MSRLSAAGSVCLAFMFFAGLIFYANVVTDSLTLDLRFSLYPDSVNTYFMHRFADEGLFATDVLAQRFNDSALVATRGFSFFAVYHWILPVVPLSVAVKLLSAVLFLFSAALVYAFGRQFFPRDQALILAGLFVIYFLSMDTFFGGSGRSFAAPFFFAFLLALERRRFLYLPPLLLLTSFFYAALCFSLATAAVLTIVFYRKEFASTRERALYILLTAAVICVCLLPFPGPLDPFYLMVNRDFVQAYKFFERVSLPSCALYPVNFFLDFVLNFNEHSALYRLVTAALIVLSLWILIRGGRGGRWLPRSLGVLMFASFLSFAAIFPFHATSASRQLVFSLPFLLIFFTTAHLLRAAGARLRPTFVLLPMACFFMIAHPFFNDVCSFRQYAPVYDYVEQLPKGAVLAGYPGSRLATSVPFFAKRQVFYCDEFRDQLFLFLHHRKLQEQRARLVEALYTDSVRSLQDFVRTTGVDYFIVESRYYDLSLISRLRHSVSPYDQWTYDYLKKGRDPASAFLWRLAREQAVFELTDEGGTAYLLPSKAVMESNK